MNVIISKSVCLIHSSILPAFSGGAFNFPTLEVAQIRRKFFDCQCGLPEEFDLDVDLEDLEKRRLKLGGLGGGFKYFLCSPLFGEMIQSD